MEIRRPVAALVAALALFGGGSAVSGCGEQESGTGTPEQVDPERVEETHDNLPDNSDPDQDNEEDQNDDSNDPD
jgi:hypothetical protein